MKVKMHFELSAGECVMVEKVLTLICQIADESGKTFDQVVNHLYEKSICNGKFHCDSRINIDEIK